jgi:starch synthase
MRVLQVSAELFPLLKTGGLADVTGALPSALARQRCDVRLLLPGFPPILAGVHGLQPAGELTTPWGERVRIRAGHFSGHVAYVVDVPALYGRGGNPYNDAAGKAHADSARRFALLGQAAAALGTGLDASWRPQVVHAHDWHAALAPAALHFQRMSGATDARSVYTVHNLAFQGLFPASAFADLGLPSQAFQMEGLEFFGQVSFMKAGLRYADWLTTVSPSYALEVQTPEQGCGLDGLLRERAAVLTGILNGVDPAIWDPAHDSHLAARYDMRHLSARGANKAALQAECGLEVRADKLLFGIVSRLTGQKGLSLVLHGLPALLERGGQLVLLGSGESELESAFAQATRAHPGSVAMHVGYDERRSHRTFAGADVILVPSRFEPCGLTQLYGLAYGCLPLVHRVGGLADTVTDASLENLTEDHATGFVFERFTDDDFDAAIRRAFTLFARPAQWKRVQRAAMRRRFDWDHAAAEYLDVYLAACDSSSA